MEWISKYRNSIILFVLLSVLYALIFLFGRSDYASGDYYYTLDWTARRILWLFAAISLFLVLINQSIAAVISTFGCLLGIVLGELIGNPLYLADVARHKQMAMDPGYIQQSSPHHYGWFICIVTFLIALVIGLIIQRVGTREPRK